MANRFDPYNDELWNCWCPLCTDLASAHTRHIPSALDAASEALFRALEAGVHVHMKPRVSLTKWEPLKYRDDGWKMREGLGIGVTPGGVTGGGRRANARREKQCD
ncbi:hypothetical protein [Streptomyces sp. SM8]|uniref:hypothetical protein n=1 Tax=Streptomyces sp. SM8 TaxID=1195457 RepID=UPI000283112D|nr:hypothetical protein [Streptomyces sp. SM8]PKA37935.1 hypothetical protein SM8_029385 [Streptomyces sp. SM8]